jgi:hypothetical protein
MPDIDFHIIDRPESTRYSKYGRIIEKLRKLQAGKALQVC